MQKLRLRIAITLFQSIFDLGVKYYLLLVLRSQLFFEYLREILYNHALEHKEAARLEYKMEKMFLPTVEAPVYY